MNGLKEIESIINRQIKLADREAAEQKINDCINILGLSARMKAEALGNLERAKGKIFNEYPELNSRKLKMLTDSQTTKEQQEYALAERLNVSLFKVIDGLKSMLSIQQEEVRW